jgi:predicted nucleotide-binding protein (sugar kinase/HSP70/actin superfamily)
MSNDGDYVEMDYSIDNIYKQINKLSKEIDSKDKNEFKKDLLNIKHNFDNYMRYMSPDHK